MAIPSGDILRIVVGGPIGGDTWSTGQWRVLTGMTGLPTPTQMNAAATAWLATFKSLVWDPATGGWRGQNNAGTALSTCRVYLYQGGLLAAQGAAAITPDTGLATPVLPAYVAGCVTLQTNTPGRSGRGRIYMPITGCTMVAATMQIQSDFTPHLAALASWLNSGVDTTMPGSPTGVPVVLSRTKTQTHQITALRMDTIPDTQHGRENKFVASAVRTGVVT